MKQKRYLIDWFWLAVKYLIISIVFVFILRGFLLIPVPVDGNSMEGTLNQNDMVVMEKFTQIQRFDVIVFQLSDGATYIKRVIGLPGDKIEYKDDQLFVNGEQVEETFLEANLAKDKGLTPYTTNFTLEDLLGVDTLPEDNYLVLGDNRRLSKDSRSFGTVEAEYIMGKVRFVYYPFNHMKPIS